MMLLFEKNSNLAFCVMNFGALSQARSRSESVCPEYTLAVIYSEWRVWFLENK